MVAFQILKYPDAVLSWLVGWFPEAIMGFEGYTEPRARDQEMLGSTSLWELVVVSRHCSILRGSG